MRQVIILLLIAAIVASCNKNKDGQSGYLCSYKYYKIAGNFGFIGYSLHDLDTIFVSRYRRHSGFSLLQGSDTFVFNQVPQNTLWPKGDTICICGTGAPQPSLTDTSDYRIFVPAAGTEFSITGIGYVLYVEYRSSTPCGAGSPYTPYSSPTTPDSAWVDGQLTYGWPRYFQIKTIFLQKK